MSAAIIFIGSYLPLSLILLAQNFRYDLLHQPLCFDLSRSGCVLPFSNPVFSLGIFLLCLFCLITSILTLELVQTKQEIVIKEAKHIPADLMNYTLPYIVSFMSISYQDTDKFIGFAIFLAWMFWITYKSGQIILNPVLIAFGWNFYEIKYRFITDNHEHVSRALTKSSIISGTRHKQVPIQEILIIK